MVHQVRHPIVGREGLVEEVEALWRDGQRVLVLEGPAGIGKTTVWSEVLSRASVIWTWSARCSEAEQGLGLAVLSDFFAAIPDDVLGELPTVQREAIDVVLFRAASANGSVTPRLLGATCVSILTTLCGRGSVLIAIDDVQWCDPASMASFDFALRRAPTALSLLATRRSHGHARGLAGERVVSVGPLSSAHVRDILDRVGADRLTPQLVAEIVDVSCGNPLYAAELARDVSPEATTFSLPASLHQVLGRRLSALPLATRSSLLDLAVRGTRIDRELSTRPELDSAYRAGVLVADRTQHVRFSHPLFAAATLADATPAQVRAAHARAAIQASDPIAQAHHLACAARAADEATAAKLDTAVTIATGRGDLQGAYDLARHALELTPGGARPARRVLTLAERALNAGAEVDGRALAREVLDHSNESSLVHRALMVIADATSSDDAAASASYYGDAAVVPGIEPGARLAARAHQGRELFNAGQRLQAQAVLALALADTKPSSHSWASLAATLAMTQRLAGIRESREVVSRAAALDREGQCEPPGSALVVAAMIKIFDCDHSAAEDLLVAAHAAMTAGGISSVAEKYRAVIAMREGRLDRADELMLECLVGRRGRIRAVALLVCAEICSWRGAHGKAGLIVAETESLLSRPCQLDQSALDAYKGLDLLLQGSPAAAHPHLMSAVAGYERFGVREPAHNRVLLAAVEAAAAAGDVASAAKFCAELERLQRALSSRWAQAAVLSCRGHIADAEGRPDAAAMQFSRSAEAFAAVNCVLEAARARLHAGRALRRSGQRAKAREQLTNARTVFQRSGALGVAGQADAELNSIGGRSRDRGDLDALTNAEQRVAQLAATGQSTRAIAGQLHITTKTVESHLHHIYQKMRVANRVELALALQSRLTATASRWPDVPTRRERSLDQLVPPVLDHAAQLAHLAAGERQGVEVR